MSRVTRTTNLGHAPVSSAALCKYSNCCSWSLLKPAAAAAAGERYEQLQYTVTHDRKVAWCCQPLLPDTAPVAVALFASLAG